MNFKIRKDLNPKVKFQQLFIQPNIWISLTNLYAYSEIMQVFKMIQCMHGLHAWTRI